MTGRPRSPPTRSPGQCRTPPVFNLGALCSTSVWKPTRPPWLPMRSWMLWTTTGPRPWRSRPEHHRHYRPTSSPTASRRATFLPGLVLHHRAYPRLQRDPLVRRPNSGTRDLIRPQDQLPSTSGTRDLIREKGGPVLVRCPKIPQDRLESLPCFAAHFGRFRL